MEKLRQLKDINVNNISFTLGYLPLLLKKNKKYTLLCLFLFLCTLFVYTIMPLPILAQARPQLDPSVIPPMPQKLPTVIVPLASAPVPLASQGQLFTINACQGWQIVSFPVGRIKAVSGVPRMLYGKSVNGFKLIDPVNHPEELEPGLAYLAYCDKPETFTYSGTENSGFYEATALHPGWNLLGCPSSKPLSWKNITLTRPGGITAKASDVGNDLVTPSSAWFYNKAYVFIDGKWHSTGENSSEITADFQPGQVVAIFCWTDLLLNWNVVPPISGYPVIKEIVPKQCSVGDIVTVKGENLSQLGYGVVSIAGNLVMPTNIVSWNPDKMQFKVPDNARTGNLRLIVNRYPSNDLRLEVVPRQMKTYGSVAKPQFPGPSAVSKSPAAKTNPKGSEVAANIKKASKTAKSPAKQSIPSDKGTLYGEVVTDKGMPIANAQVYLSDGQNTLTNKKGVFQFDNLTPKQTKIFISAAGYNQGKGSVDIKPGELRTLKVQLSGVGSKSQPYQEEKGSFTVSARPFRARGDKVRFYVYKIEVWESGHSSKSWRNTWWSDNNDSSYDLNCSNAYLDRNYEILITWRSSRKGREKTLRSTKNFYKSGQTFTFYNP